MPAGLKVICAKRRVGPARPAAGAGTQAGEVEVEDDMGDDGVGGHVRNLGAGARGCKRGEEEKDERSDRRIPRPGQEAGQAGGGGIAADSRAAN